MGRRRYPTTRGPTVTGSMAENLALAVAMILAAWLNLRLIMLSCFIMEAVETVVGTERRLVGTSEVREKVRQQSAI